MNHFITTIISVFLFFTISISLPAQTRRALVIGLGQQEDEEWGKINGDKDVALVEEMLLCAGFGAENVTTLVNKRATKGAIVEAFERLTDLSKRGDIIYVHFSGHGQQMRDADGDEKDGLDECWIPYDAYRRPCDKDRGEKHLTDDEVNDRLNVIRDRIGDEGMLLVVIDACHSGDGTRGNDDEVVRGVEDVFRVVRSFFQGPDAEKNKGKVVNPDARERRERWITLSACQSDQVNIEMKSPVAGKLTYALYKKIKENPASDNDAFFRQIRRFVNTHTGSRPQHPVMSGEIHRYRITDILR